MAAVTAAVPAAAPGALAPSRRRGRRGAPWIALAVVALLAGLWAGLVLLGLPIPTGGTDLAEAHGPLMALAFLGTLIGMERAVALDRAWAYLCPIAAGLGGLATAVRVPLRLGPALLTAAGLVLVAIFAAVYRIQPALHTVVMAAGAVCWPVAGVLWLAGWDVPRFVPFLAGFLVLTIAGERLELSRMADTAPFAWRGFLGVAGILAAGLVVALWVEPVGVRIAGLGLLGVAAWLARYDIARRTVRMPGVTRYMAAALLAGFLWLATAGVLWAVSGRMADGRAYDAMLHAIFLGFVISMVFAHAPVIVPAVLGTPLPFSRGFYVQLLLLHASIALRLVGGDAAGNPTAWQLGGVLNEAALLLFLCVTAGAVVRARRRRRTASVARSARPSPER